MTQTTLLLLLGVVGLVMLLLVVAVVGWFLLRRRGAANAPEVDEETVAEDSPPQQPARKLSRLDTSENGTTQAARNAPAPTASPPSVSSSPGALPIADMEHPVEIGDKIKILIVDDNPGTRDNVSRLLYFEKDMDVIGQAINGRQGIEMAVELRPHIVLMDINMPDVDGITATSEMSLRVPYCQVIIMSVQAERHYMKQAMSAGARDFQPKPFTAEELISCIRRVYQIGIPVYRQIEASEQAGATMATSTPRASGSSDEGGADGAVIAVYSAKGGIGTSTLAINVAAALQQMHGEVALIDGDLQFGDIFVHLNIKPTRTMSDSIHNSQFDAELLPELMLAHNSGMKVLLAPPQPELADAITPEMLATMIKTLRKHFKVVVIDVSRQLTDKSLSILDNADRILMITAPELTAIKNAKLFLELAPQLEFPPEKIDVVMNYAKLPGGVPVEKIEKALQLSQSFPIPYDPRLRTATNKGVTVIQQDAGAPAAKAIMALAKAVWQKVGAPGGKERIAEAV